MYISNTCLCKFVSGRLTLKIMYARTYVFTVTPESHGLYHSFVFLSLSYRKCNLICSTPGPHEAFYKELGRLGEPSPNKCQKFQIEELYSPGLICSYIHTSRCYM